MPSITPFIISTNIVVQIMNNLEDRKGIGDELSQIDPDIYDELREDLANIIERALDKELNTFVTTGGDAVKGYIV